MPLASTTNAESTVRLFIISKARANSHAQSSRHRQGLVIFNWGRREG